MDEFELTTIDPANVAKTPGAQQGYWEALAATHAQDEANVAAHKGVSFGGLWEKAVGIDHIVPSLIDADMRNGREFDPEWSPPESITKHLEASGLPVYWADEFDDVGSEAEFQLVTMRLQRRFEEEQFISSAGGKGMLARVAANMSDPVGVGIDAVASIAGGAGAVNRFRRVAGAVTAAGASNSVIGTVQGTADPDWNLNHVAVDFAAGAAFGVLFEGIGTAFSKSERNELSQAIGTWARNRQGGSFGADTASAARVPGVATKPNDTPDFAMESAAGGESAEELAKRAEANETVDTTKWGETLRQIPGLDDASMHFSRNVDPEVRQMGRDAMFDPVRRVRILPDGSRVDEVNADGFTDTAERLSKVLYGVKFRAVSEEAFKDMAASTPGFGGYLDRMKQRIAPGFQRAFYERVGRAAKGFTDDAADPHVSKALGALNATMRETLERAKRAGVQGADRIKLDDGYFTRYRKRNLVDYLKVRTKGSTDPLELKVQELIGEGIRSALRAEGRAIDDVVTEKVAKHYAEYLWTGSVEDTRRGVGMTTPDMNYIDEVLEEAGVGRGTIDEISDAFAIKDEKGVASDRFKPRLKMDETVSVKLDNGETITLADLFETDASYVAERYVREMSGKIAMAEKGYKNWRDWFNIVDKKLNVDKSISEADAKLMRNAGSHALGRPIEALGAESATVNKIARTLGGLNYLRAMGSAVFAQIGDSAKIISYAGGRAVWKQIPAFRSIVKEVASGRIEAPLAREMAALTGDGTSLIRNSVSMRYDEFNLSGLDSSAAFKQLDKANHIAQRVQSIASLLAPMTDFQQKIASRAFAQKLYDYAHAVSDISKADRARLLDYGLSAADFNRLKAHMRKHAVAENGTLTEVNLAAMPLDLQETLAGVIGRGTKHAVQEQSFAATSPLMHGSIASLLFQFRKFGFTSFSRQLLHGVSRHDAVAGMAFLSSWALATVALLGRTQINYGGDSERMKRLTSNPDELFKASWQMTGESSVLPMLIEAGASMTGSDPVFGNAGRGTDLATGAILGNPSVDFIVKASRAAGIPFNAARTDRQVTQQEVKDLASLLPFANLMGAKRFIAAISEKFPEEDLNRTP